MILLKRKPGRRRKAKPFPFQVAVDLRARSAVNMLCTQALMARLLVLLASSPAPEGLSESAFPQVSRLR